MHVFKACNAVPQLRTWSEGARPNVCTCLVSITVLTACPLRTAICVLRAHCVYVNIHKPMLRH